MTEHMFLETWYADLVILANTESSKRGVLEEGADQEDFAGYGIGGGREVGMIGINPITFCIYSGSYLPKLPLSVARFCLYT